MMFYTTKAKVKLFFSHTVYEIISDESDPESDDESTASSILFQDAIDKSNREGKDDKWPNIPEPFHMPNIPEEQAKLIKRRKFVQFPKLLPPRNVASQTEEYNFDLSKNKLTLQSNVKYQKIDKFATWMAAWNLFMQACLYY